MDRKKLIMASWEIGYASTKLGMRVGGLGLVLQELPLEMAKYAQSTNRDIEIEVLSPCFGCYDRAQLYHEGTLWDPHFNMNYDVYSHIFTDCEGFKIKHLYFWNEQILENLGKDGPQTVYPGNNWDAIRLYARLSAVMATYITVHGCDAIHLHDYHLGLIPFYLDSSLVENPSIVFTIHNATYQGWLHIWNDPGPVMYEIGLPIECYYRYLQYWGNINIMKGVLLKIGEMKGTVTTVSEGYAKELGYSEDDIRRFAVEEGRQFPRKVFVPNSYLSELAWAGIKGVNNGLAQVNLPENLNLFKAKYLLEAEQKQNRHFFENPDVEKEMTSEDHNYSLDNYANRIKLRELMYRECFSKFPQEKDMSYCMVGRLTMQKNFEILPKIMVPIIRKYPFVHFIILVSVGKGEDINIQNLQKELSQLAAENPNNIWYKEGFNEPLNKLILAGSDFCIVPSKFEPCGLIDYEAALLGNIPIVRKTGGLIKTFPYSFAYSWYDEDDPQGEARALIDVIEYAIYEYFEKNGEHQDRIKGCMGLDTRWDNAVKKYFEYLKI